MKVDNVHERVLPAPAAMAGALIDSLASPHDLLWPRDRWPAMVLDRPLGIGAAGGHAQIRYVVEEYEPSRSVRFRFTGPRGFEGHHCFEVEEIAPDRCRLRHVVDMRVTGWARLLWLVGVRSLHDALIEDALDRAEAHVGGRPAGHKWSLWVRVLKRIEKHVLD